MRSLILFIHADPAVGPTYRKALAPIGDFDMPIVYLGGYSNAYSEGGRRFRGADGRVLPQLVARYAPRHLDNYDQVALITFSAGYAMAREVLQHPKDREALSALVMLDSLHAGFDPDHTASDGQLSHFVEFAKRAQQGGCLFWLGHTDVTTPQTGPGAFASTTQAANELVRLAGPPSGKFLVRAYDLEKDPLVEHRRVLADQGPEHHAWGPDFCAEALVPWLGSGWHASTPPAPAPTPPAPPVAGPFGNAVLSVAAEDLNAGIREHGHNAGPEIEELYLKPLGLPTGSNYCASAVTSWIRRAAARRGVPMPVPGSGGAKALGDQFKAIGQWKAAPLRPEDLEPGDVLVWDRSNPKDPTTEWHGHTAIADAVGTETVWTVEANADRPPPCDAVCMVARPIKDPLLLGRGRFP